MNESKNVPRGTWVNDAAASLQYAMRNPRGPYAPHWVRCEYVRDGIRCCKGVGHVDSHEEPSVPRGTPA